MPSTSGVMFPEATTSTHMETHPGNVSDGNTLCVPQTSKRSEDQPGSTNVVVSTGHTLIGKITGTDLNLHTTAPKAVSN